VSSRNRKAAKPATFALVDRGKGRVELVAADDKPRRPDAVERALVALGRAAWRNRRPLAPVVTGLAVAAGAAGDPVAAAFTCGAAAVAGHLGTSGAIPATIRGRKLLSVRERSTMTLWAAGATAWSGWVSTGHPVDNPVTLAGLAVATGAQTIRWWSVARVRKPKPAKLTDRARYVLEAWPVTVDTDTAPAALRGSTIIRDTVAEPAPGTVTFALQLAGHAEDAKTDTVRRYLEVKLHQGVGTVHLAVDRDDATLLRVTLAAERHLEKVEAVWEGPVLHPNGEVELALTDAGAQVRAATFNEAGAEPAAIVGPMGVGKSNDLSALILPGVHAGVEVVFYIDGGNGTSAAHLAGACDWYAVEGPDEWEAALRSAVSILRARRQRRRRKGLSAWRGWQEDDPVLTIVVDESALVRAQFDPKTLKVIDELMLELVRIARKLGGRVIQITQDPMGDEWLGGRKARGMMAGAGTLIGHRPGDGTAAMLSVGSSSSGIDLRALPPEPGWAAVIRRGQVLAERCRIRYARPEQVLELLANHTPRELAGEDLLAAGPAYRERVRGVDAAAEMRGEEPEQKTSEAAPKRNAEPEPVDPAAASADPEPTNDELMRAAIAESLTKSQQAAALAHKTNGRLILDTLAGFDEGLTVKQLTQELPLSESTVKRTTQELAAVGAIRKTDDRPASYVLAA
jgi:hypothetical protein